MKAILLCLLLAGCASGVHMTDEEARACRDAPTGCAVFTEAEFGSVLQSVIQQAGKAGYEQGWRDANKQAQRGM